MNVTYVGGTPQQRQWALDALAASSYPYTDLDVAVAVTWAPSTPCGLHHSYMCTTDHGDGTFTITIASDADDPHSDKVSGLADPAADIKRFYMESFIHETGHVVHYTLINDDGLRTLAAGLFWAAVANDTGRVYGTLADYSPVETSTITWAGAIVEAIAETIKVAFYQGHLIYGNRTAWHIKPAQWSALMELLLPASAGFIDALSSYDITKYGPLLDPSRYGGFSWSASNALWSGGESPGLKIDPGATSGFGGSACGMVNQPVTLRGDAMVSVKIAQVFFGAPAALLAQVKVGRVTALGADTGYGEDIANVAFTRALDSTVTVTLDYGSSGPTLSLGDVSNAGPYWLAYRSTSVGISHELWDVEPDTTSNAGALLVVSYAVHPDVGPCEAKLVGAASWASVADVAFQQLVLTDWRYTSLVTVTPPPYPFDLVGLANVGTGASGTIAVH